MEVKMLERGENFIKFRVKGISVEFANALRRIITSEIPCMAIDYVDFYENDSVFFDEIIAHRLAMIPLSFPPDKFNLRENCTCSGKGCAACQAMFVIDKTGPCTVYSRDMKPSNEEVVPLNGDFPIAKLRENQRLRLEAFTRLGKAKEHAKFQAGIASYSYDENGNFEFYVESYTSLTPEYLVQKALKILKSKAEDFISKVEKI